MSNRALIVVDLQNEYYPGGKLPLVGIEKATANARRLIEATRNRGEVIIHVRHEMPAAGEFSVEQAMTHAAQPVQRSRSRTNPSWLTRPAPPRPHCRERRHRVPCRSPVPRKGG